MANVVFGHIKDIVINEHDGFNIKVIEENENVTPINMARDGIELFIERGEVEIHGYTYTEMKTEFEDKLRELREENEQLRSENTSLRLGYK